MTIVQLDPLQTQTEHAAKPSVRASLTGMPSQRLIRIGARVAFAVAVLVILFTWRQTGIW